MYFQISFFRGKDFFQIFDHYRTNLVMFVKKVETGFTFSRFLSLLTRVEKILAERKSKVSKVRFVRITFHLFESRNKNLSTRLFTGENLECHENS